MRRALSILFMLAAVAELGIVVVTGVHGGPWTLTGWRVENPWPWLAVGIVGWIGWYVLRLGPRPTREQWKLAVARLVLLVVSSAVSLVGAELAVRYLVVRAESSNDLEQLAIPTDNDDGEVGASLKWFLKLSPDRRLVYELRPNIDRKMGRRLVRSNSAGMVTTREFTKQRHPSSFRIVGVGDSGMFGWGVEAGEDYMSRLQARLDRRRDGITYEVINFSAPGYNTQQEVELVRYKGLPYEPDVVVIGWNLNDKELPFFMYEGKDHFGWDESYLISFLFRREQFADALRPRMRRLKETEKKFVHPKILEGVGPDGVRRALEELLALRDKHGFEVLVFGAMDADVVDLCRELGLSYYDTFEEIPATEETEELKIHWLHPRKKGHLLLSEHLESALIREGFLPEAPSSRPAGRSHK